MKLNQKEFKKEKRNKKMMTLTKLLEINTEVINLEAGENLEVEAASEVEEEAVTWDKMKVKMMMIEKRVVILKEKKDIKDKETETEIKTEIETNNTRNMKEKRNPSINKELKKLRKKLRKKKSQLKYKRRSHKLNIKTLMWMRSQLTGVFLTSEFLLVQVCFNKLC
jgi:hypothetical protein